ncbi:hypothetical protein [Chloroflexus aggregans]|uniref:Uncharacterized protein n=1 Tax=Chloroflexus aggregans (strain MD-66 / DSM 9485) TaxID=326427 RepID=B8GAX3_CHLAD|nr:hypothetical protein [Chloroflexus aggregans]ACL26573.1 conserved hypothetical protein [Chloroflexus aggregans DSM 9485]
MITLVFELILVLLVASLLAFWNGWGLARLLLPAAVAPWRALLSPLLGYALTILVGYWVVRFIGGLGWALGLIALLSGWFNWLAWRWYGPPQIIMALHHHWPGLVVAGIAVAFGVAPLLSYGYAAPIGGGWDIENYWPTARYLVRGPVSAIATAPPNPLRDINADPPRIGLTLGFSIWQGSVDLLSGSEPLVSFAPLLAWLRALGVVGIYVLLQAVFTLRRGPAAFAALLAALNGLLLWTSYFNFGMQLAAWPLLPLVLTLGLATVRADAERWATQSLVGRVAHYCAAAMSLAAIPVAYYPALGPLGLMAVGIGIVVLGQTRDRWRLIKRSLVLLLLTLALAAPTIPDYFAGFNYRYSLPLTTLGLFRFIPLSDIVGFTIFRLREVSEPLTVPAWVAAAMLIVLVGYGLITSPQRWYWVGMLAGASSFLLYLRFGAVYHYGYLKAAAYVGWMAGALAASGLQAMLDHLRSRSGWQRVLVTGSVTVLIGSPVALTAIRVVADHWGKPALFADQLPVLRELRQLVPVGSTVRLTGDPRVEGVTSALAAYLLDHTRVWGNVRTGYASSSAGESDAIAEYALLQRDEDPTLWGYTDPPIWSGGSYRLYRRPSETVAHLIWQHIVDKEAVTLPIIGERLASEETVFVAEREPRWIALQTASFTPAELIINGERYGVPAGRSRVVIGPLRKDQKLTLQAVDRPVQIQTVSLLTTRSKSQVSRFAHSVTIKAASVADGSTVATSIDMLNADSGPVVVALELWERRQGILFGRYGLRVMPSAEVQQATVTLDLATGAARAQDAAGAPIVLGVDQGASLPGTYIARLWVGTDQRALLTPVDLFTFTIDRQGAVTVDWTAQTSLLTAQIERPLQPLSVQFGDDMLLRGYDLSTTQATPGETIALTLWWQALRGNLDERSIMVHVRNGQDERIIDADGPPAGGGRPTSVWQGGELIIDERHITIPTDVLPGHYWLVIGSYRWPSLAPIPRVGADEAVWRIPIEIVARR